VPQDRRAPTVVSEADVQSYEEQGYHLGRSVLTADECDEIIARAEELHARKHVPGCFRAADVDESDGDPLRVYPRMMHPHRVDDRCLHYLTHPSVVAILRDLLRDGVTALQSMFYWKPPGARGQAYHQDDFYLQTKPDACIAAWTALERIDAENGALRVFPGSHVEDILDMLPTNTAFSFTSEAVTPPAQYANTLVEMDKGDVLFFDGRLIHGSLPNVSDERFRRAYICHYIPESAASYNHGYDPAIPLR
jgi:ectoine hydroxylase-related dioxygenase (phytanoyl-CoA dioxygenase family)